MLVTVIIDYSRKWLNQRGMGCIRPAQNSDNLNHATPWQIGEGWRREYL